MKPYHIDFPNVKNNCLRFDVSPSIEEKVLAVEVAAPGVDQFGATPVFVFQPGEEAHRVLRCV